MAVLSSDVDPELLAGSPGFSSVCFVASSEWKTTVQRSNRISSASITSLSTVTGSSWPVYPGPHLKTLAKSLPVPNGTIAQGGDWHSESWPTLSKHWRTWSQIKPLVIGNAFLLIIGCDNRPIRLFRLRHKLISYSLWCVGKRINCWIVFKLIQFCYSHEKSWSDHTRVVDHHFLNHKLDKDWEVYGMMR